LDGTDQQQLYAGPCKAVSTQIWFFDSYFSWDWKQQQKRLKTTTSFVKWEMEFIFWCFVN
jgi:hypothetical protein